MFLKAFKSSFAGFWKGLEKASYRCFETFNSILTDFDFLFKSVWRPLQRPSKAFCDPRAQHNKWDPRYPDLARPSEPLVLAQGSLGLKGPRPKIVSSEPQPKNVKEQSSERMNLILSIIRNNVNKQSIDRMHTILSIIKQLDTTAFPHHVMQTQGARDPN